MREGSKIGTREMVEVEKCLDGLLKLLGFVEALGERKSLQSRDKDIFNGVLKREGELINNGGRAKANDRVLVIEG